MVECDNDSLFAVWARFESLSWGLVTTLELRNGLDRGEYINVGRIEIRGDAELDVDVKLVARRKTKNERDWRA